jgi:hypothetical protein
MQHPAATSPVRPALAQDERAPGTRAVQKCRRSTALKSEGRFYATRRGDTIYISGSATHSVKDPYNFEDGPLYGDDAHLLERHGLAQWYNRSASWTRRVSGTIELRDGQLRNPDFIWQDEDDDRSR